MRQIGVNDHVKGLRQLEIFNRTRRDFQPIISTEKEELCFAIFFYALVVGLCEYHVQWYIEVSTLRSRHHHSILYVAL